MKTDKECKIGSEHSLRLYIVLVFGGRPFQGFRFRLEGRNWRLSLVQDMAPSFSLCIRQPKPTATTVIILLWLTHGSASLACLSWHQSSRVSHFSLASAALGFLIYRLLNAKICFRV